MLKRYLKKISEHGNKLVNLHLLKSQELDSPAARFQVERNNRIEKPKYVPAGCHSREQSEPGILQKDSGQDGMTEKELGRVYINKEQYFEGISGPVWSYQIGGYQVCDKWLKDRKKRVLTLDEIQTYCEIVTAINKTIEIKKGIDESYEEIEKTI